jgi:hypothetical protein
VGILVSIGKAAAVAETANDLLDQLSASRSVSIEVHNHTDHELRVVSDEHDYGNFGEPPSQRIPPEMVDIYSSRHSSWRPRGTAGSVTYRIGTSGVNATVEWRNRRTPGRRNRSGATLSGNDRQRFRLTNHIGEGGEANARYELFEREDQRRGGGGRETGDTRRRDHRTGDTGGGSAGGGTPRGPGDPPRHRK